VSSIDLTGRVAVVTGAGRGIGRAHALELARRGAAVVVNGASAASTLAVTAEVDEQGGDAVACVADIATHAGATAVLEAALDRWGRVDILVNNAGRRSPAPFDELTDDDLDPVFDSHLKGAFYMTQRAWGVMKDAGFGRIVMTSSSAGLFSCQGLSNYATAKAGLYGLTKALAYEGRDLGITCNVILPYAITNSPGNERLVASATTERQKYVAEDQLSQLDPARWDPSLTAHLVAYLASDGCTVTGEAFSCCQGRYARVFVGVTDGWLAPDPTLVDAESIARHFDEIRALTSFTAPESMYDELAEVVRRIVADGDHG